MNRPSSTITAATLAAMSVTFGWEVWIQFSDAPVRATLVAASVTLASALVGYFKRENVLG